MKFFGAYQPSSNTNAAFRVDLDSTSDLGTDGSDQALWTKAVGKKKARPGYEDNAAKRSTNLLNSPNGKGAEIDAVNFTDKGRRSSDVAADRPVIQTDG